MVGKSHQTRPPTPGAFVASLSWLEVEKRIANGAAGVLPVGASAKEHGYHLPMNTDQAQAEWLAQRLTEKFDILVWPTVGYGYYPAFTEYPGSCSISEHTFTALVREILSELYRHRVQKVVILNTGISTKTTLMQVSAETTDTHLINVYEGPAVVQLSRTILRQLHGGHADERETSIMLAIDADAVRMNNCVAWDRPATNGPLRRHDDHDPNYCPAGVIGDPTLASPEKGRMLLAAMIDDISAYFHQNINLRAVP
jgi:creatinine amidohydrolase